MKMKRLVLTTIGLAALVTGLSVGEAHGAPRNPVCVNAHSIATDVMGMRQKGIAISVPRSMVQSPLANAIIDSAYDEPILTKGERAQFIKDFADDMSGICDEALAGR